METQNLERPEEGPTHVSSVIERLYQELLDHYRHQRLQTDLEDVLQETFLKVLDKASQCHGQTLEQIRNLVLQIFHHTRANYQRSNRTRDQYQQQWVEQIEQQTMLTVLDHLIEEESWQQLWSVVEDLPEREQLLFRQLCWERKSSTELATTLKISPESIRQLKRRLLKQLRQKLNPFKDTDEQNKSDPEI